MKALDRAIRALALGTSLLPAACAGWAEEGNGPAGPGNPPSHGKGPNESTPAPLPPPSSQGTVIKLRGSTTIGLILAPRLAMSFLAQAGATDAKLDESAKSQARVLVSGHVKGELVTFVIETPGSGVAFQCLRDKSCDIGMSSRPVFPDEVAALGSLGDMTAPTNEHVVAMDGIAVIVNRANRVSKLTMAQIAGIFSGSVTQWSQVDGAGGEIHRYTRDRKSGTYETFAEFALRGKDLAIAGATIEDDNESLSAAVAKDENGIGFVGLPYVNACKALAVQDGNATPLAPSTFSVATEDYAFSRRLYLYTAEHVAQPAAAQFIDYALSDAAQKTVGDTGFVPLSVDASSSPTLPTNAPADYRKAVDGARRLSFDFRFRAGTPNLDGKAVADIDRLGRYLKANTTHPNLVLFGFADNHGSEAENLELSRQRARVVADELRQRSGIAPTSTDGYGSALPLAPNDTAPNDTEEGRKKNRRVEVWLVNR
jgi:phosphate transport system substrate-binding protein